MPRYEDGDFVGYVGTAIDIHERKTMEAELREVYEREHTIAETLQRSLLPERLPRIDGLELAARYLPAGRGAAIGGDWYDVLERPDGKVALVVGDVVGHGLRAAATMGQLRNAFRAYGLAESSPAEVMARVNRLMLSGEEEVMATALYLVFDREGGEVCFASAGHPPPLVLEPGATRFLEGGRSVPIGAVDPGDVPRGDRGDRARRRGAALHRRPGGAPRRGRWRRASPSLAEAAARAPAGLEGLCDAVLAGVIGEHMPGDDVALLAVRPRPVASESIGFTLPAEPDSLPDLRRRMARFLHAAGADEIEAYEITLTVCEAAGNAIEHAYGPGDATFEVEARFDARRADRDRARPGPLARAPRHAPRSRAEHHGGPDGPGRGLGAERRHDGADAPAAARGGRGVSSLADIELERRNGVVVARLSGEVDMTNAGFVRDELLAAVPNDAIALIVDLGGCRYLDSAAIEVVFDVSRRLDRRRQELRLVVPETSPLGRVLELTDVGSVAPVHSTLEGALAQ